ncbi:hypothetical protein C8R44DRAFT_747891 [Mycena epipterygia]|nr:hypothetical protein C8R44DRAFT_747891 [Mycena epipterygia]
MARFLAGLTYNTDFGIGPPRKTRDGRTMHSYVDSQQELLQVLILALVPPEVTSPIVQDLFKRQTQVLDDVLTQENSSTTRSIQSNQGVVYIRVSRDTIKSIFDSSLTPNGSTSPFEIINNEIPKESNDVDVLSPGALVVCYAYPFRADAPIGNSSAAERIFARNILHDNRSPAASYKLNVRGAQHTAVRGEHKPPPITSQRILKGYTKKKNTTREKLAFKITQISRI